MDGLTEEQMERFARWHRIDQFAQQLHSMVTSFDLASDDLFKEHTIRERVEGLVEAIERRMAGGPSRRRPWPKA